jgi:predicted MFS family arabinose efflux permease
VSEGWSVKGAAWATFAAAEDKALQLAGGPARLQVIVVLAAVLGLDTADKATVSAVAAGLEHAFHIGNAQIGILIAVVSFVGAAVTLPLGTLVDRISRRWLLIAAITLWSVAMVVSGTANSFLYLLVTRIFLGGITAAATPAVASLIGDYFPARERAKVYGLILSGELVGTGLGFFIAGEVSSLLGWRWPFFLMFIPGAALAWAIWRFLPEPARGGQAWIAAGQQEVHAEGDGQADQDGSGEGAPGEAAAFAQQTALDQGIEPRRDLI